MKNYIEQENGYLVLGSTTFPNQDKALAEVEAGEATIDAWEGSQRQADLLEAEFKRSVNTPILEALTEGDRSVVRAIVAGETERVEAWRIEADALRSQLVA